MKKIIIMLAILVSSLASAQSFDFSCSSGDWVLANDQYTNSDFPTYAVTVVYETNLVARNGIYIFTIFRNGTMVGNPYQSGNGVPLSNSWPQIEIIITRL